MTVAAPNSDASPQERSTSSQPQFVVPISGLRRPRYVPRAIGETFSDPEVKCLPADTPRGPKFHVNGSLHRASNPCSIPAYEKAEAVVFRRL